jgi:hypothetical protein
MPYCPKCRDEFQDWVIVCPDCGVTLTSYLPDIPEHRPELDKGDEPLVHVATAPNEVVANMWADILKQEGIHSLVKNGMARLIGMFLPLNDACEIHVLASQAERARQILASFLKEN